MCEGITQTPMQFAYSQGSLFQIQAGTCIEGCYISFTASEYQLLNERQTSYQNTRSDLSHNPLHVRKKTHKKIKIYLWKHKHIFFIECDSNSKIVSLPSLFE